jgi:gliding motility-associated-like protein
MMNRVLLILLLLMGCFFRASADHITGGEIFYTYTGGSNGMYDYNITIRLYMRCNSGREFNNPTIISIFDKTTGERFNDYSVLLSRTENLSLANTDPCISNPPIVCYVVAYYQLHVSLPAASGYIITAHVMFRIDGIKNLVNNYDRVGATYVAEIPSAVNEAAKNTSAHFIGEDLVVICANNAFTYSFAATDADGDKLRYSFCNAYRTMNNGGFGNSVEPPPAPPYESVPYGNNYTGNLPLGLKVKIDPQTGLINGTAPDPGNYIVSVCVEEIRDGVVIATQHKDLQLNVAPCSIIAAALPEDYMLCGNSKTVNAVNQSTNPLIQTYNWEITDKDGATLFSSTDQSITHTFADTGIYTIKLVINRDQVCSDSSTAIAHVYPGFEPDFNISAPCIIRPTQFTDATSSLIGTVNKWDWDFGQTDISTDFAVEQNPAFTYPNIGKKLVRMIAENTVGCRDTIFKTIDIFDKPPIDLAYRDTLICIPDALKLQARGNGTFKWSPAASVSDPNIAAPLVSPTSTTTYYVDLDVDGCINRDSVNVRVVDRVSLDVMNDAVICTGDSILLDLQTDGLKFIWTPALSLSNASLKSPTAAPGLTTTYEVVASISNCVASDQVTVTTVPYPLANAGIDTSICFNSTAQLHASTDGSSFTWSPVATLQDGTSLDPVARPGLSTSYILYAYDTRGCPKAGTDTVFVNVEPPLNAFAGKDTTAVINQPLQLQATGGLNYSWSPPVGLSAIDIANPVARFSNSPAEGYYIYKVLVSDATGCLDSALVRVDVYSTMPEIYVPSAFTPNNDGTNDFFKLVAAGIQNIQLFQVYNRWGQMVYSSPVTHSTGWDGVYNGKAQPVGTYVWMVKAVDYLGHLLLRRGTVTLIR